MIEILVAIPSASSVHELVHLIVAVGFIPVARSIWCGLRNARTQLTAYTFALRNKYQSRKFRHV